MPSWVAYRSDQHIVSRLNRASIVYVVTGLQRMQTDCCDTMERGVTVHVTADMLQPCNILFPIKKVPAEQLTGTVHDHHTVDA